MGRPPVGKKAMTPAERQRRRRAKLAKANKENIARKIRLKYREKSVRDYMPAPPGITLWERVPHQLPDGSIKHILAPLTKPLPVVALQLEDDEALELLHQLLDIARRRGLDPSRRLAPVYPSHKEIREHETTGGTMHFGALEGGGMDGLLYYVKGE
jgi:hypothetical protein